MNHTIEILADGGGHWFRITDTRTGAVVRTTWAKGSYLAAKKDAEQVVASIEWIETMARAA